MSSSCIHRQLLISDTTVGLSAAVTLCLCCDLINQYNDLAVSLSILSSQFSLTSLFYGEPSEKEKSPSESSPSDSETKDMVSFIQVWLSFEFFISSYSKSTKEPLNSIFRSIKGTLWILSQTNTVLFTSCFSQQNTFYVS